jgi:hypothetical protein
MGFAGPPTQTTGLVRQIPRHSQIPIEPADSNNLSVCLDQQPENVWLLVTEQQTPNDSTVPTHHCRQSVHTPPTIGAFLVDEAAHHDLPIRLESGGLSHRCSVVRIGRFDNSVERCIQFPRLDETTHAGFRVAQPE